MSLSEVVRLQENAALVRVRFKDNVPEQERLNNALAGMNDDERIAFFGKFFDLWYKTSHEGQAQESPERAEMQKLIGTGLDAYLGHRLTCTWTGDKKQFRCWYANPGRMSFSHVDSGGYGNLFEITGDQDRVRWYAERIGKMLGEPMWLPNGVIIWLLT